MKCRCVLRVLFALVLVGTVGFPEDAHAMALGRGIKRAFRKIIPGRKPSPPPPAARLILSQPVSVDIDEGFDATLTVSAKPGATFQWKRNGADLEGQTDSSITLTDAQFTQSGDYTALVSVGSATEESLPGHLNVRANETVDRSQFIHQIFAGYQGWFSAPGDGADDRWVHWSGGTPRAGNVTFDLYPDVREYDASDLFRTSLANLGNGQPARLFSSKRDGVVDTHYRWISQYGIDGFAVQRFTVGVRTSAGGDPGLDRMRRLAEKWGKSFYVMYDVSGQSSDRIFGTITGDWENNIENALHLPASPSYARADGKPVVAIWGHGFPGRGQTPGQLSSLIDWFHARGVFVIGGLPLDWRTWGPPNGFLPAYMKLDMIEPWAVGTMGNDDDVRTHYAGYLVPDKAFCDQYGIRYRRVIWPGFSWANWNAPPRNGIPRRGGDFMWTQAFYASLLKSGAFIAMFDEYDEGTAIAKAAENISMIPTDQWFLTLDADGRNLSSDFYLRLAGEATRMIQGTRSRTQRVPIPDR